MHTEDWPTTTAEALAVQARLRGLVDPADLPPIEHDVALPAVTPETPGSTSGVVGSGCDDRAALR